MRKPWYVALVASLLLVAALAPRLTAQDVPPPEAQPAAAADGPLTAQQRQVAERFNELERLLLRMAELTAPSDPRRAALLRQAVAQSKERAIEQQFETLLDLLRQERLAVVVKGQGELQQDLARLLDLLLSEDRSKRIESEKERIREYLKRVNKIIKEQKGIQGETAREGDARELADKQGELAEKTGELAKDLKDESKAAQAAQGENQPGEGKQSEGEDNQGGESKDSSESPEGKKSEQGGKSGKDDEQKDAEQKDADKPDSDKQSPEDKDGEDKPGEKQSDKKDEPGDKQDKPGEKSESKDAQPSEGKDSKGQPGEQGGQPQQGQPQQGQQGEQGEQGQQGQQSQPSDNPAQQRIEQAQKRMKEAQEKLEQAKRDDAKDKQAEALRELEQAKADLEEILRQLREEEMSRTLAMLESRFRKMLDQQVEVFEGTKRLDKVPQAERDRDDEIEAGRLSRKEAQISTEAEKALEVLREEGSAVAFPAAVEEMRDDMEQVVARLAQAKVGEVTQGIEQDIIAALEEMIASLQKAQKDLEQKAQQGDPGQAGGSDEPPLVDTLSELKMIRALQMRVNTRTQRYAEMTKDEQADTPELLDALKRLAERQQRIHQVTRDIVVGRNR